MYLPYMLLSVQIGNRARCLYNSVICACRQFHHCKCTFHQLVFGLPQTAVSLQIVTSKHSIRRYRSSFVTFLLNLSCPTYSSPDFFRTFTAPFPCQLFISDTRRLHTQINSVQNGRLILLKYICICAGVHVHFSRSG